MNHYKNERDTKIRIEYFMCNKDKTLKQTLNI